LNTADLTYVRRGVIKKMKEKVGLEDGTKNEINDFPIRTYSTPS